MAKPQSFENHAKFVPLYHFVALFGFVVNLGWTGYRLVVAPGYGTGVGVLLAVSLLILFFAARVFALTVQDRVIRLEMRLRMKDVLPADLQPRILEFTPGQLVALRFASDGELPDLARAVLKDGIKDKKTIKQMITHWQADELRA
jgi:hypothetical protein